MKKNYFLFLALCSVFIFSGCSNDKTVTIESLVEEMADRDMLAMFPESNYRSVQASSYNRESVSPDLPGWFADSDGVGYIREEEGPNGTEWVLMEDEGPGCIGKIWAVCFYYGGLNDTEGGNIKIYLDGAKEPVINTNFFKLVKGQDFVKKPFADESTRAGNLYLPIPYQKSCKVTMDKKSFYNIINYRKYPEGTPVKTFTMEDYQKAAPTLERVGKILTETPNFDKGKEFEVDDKTIQPGEALNLDLEKGSNAVKYFEISLKAEDMSQALRSTVLKMTFDSEETVWCPVGDFFNNGLKIHPYKMWERTVESDGKMICRWVMPYRESAVVTIENMGEQPVVVDMEVRTDKWKWNDRSMYFHATWRMENPHATFPLFDWNLLDVEGQGVFIGDQFTVINPTEGWWGEGDEKIYVDGDFDKKFPSHFGTGTEDYYGWAGGVVPTSADEFSKPFLGNILVGTPNARGHNTCTRTRVMDAIPFSDKFRFDLESSCGTRQSWFHLQYSAVAYWYAKPGAKHNRQPLPDMAKAKHLYAEDIQAINDKARADVFVVDGAIECENLRTLNIGNGVTKSDKPMNIWGEVSNNDMVALWFTEPGQEVSLKITEQFSKARLELCAVVSPEIGMFDIYVNGEKKGNYDFYTGHPGMTTPYIDLGVNEPVNSAFDVKFVFTGANPGAKKSDKGYGLGLDFFLVK